MLGKENYANGQKIYVLEGDTLTYYFKNGKTKAYGRYENGKMEGEWRFYRASGELWQVGNFRDGEKNGSWIRYDRDQNLEYQAEFVNGKE